MVRRAPGPVALAVLTTFVLMVAVRLLAGPTVRFTGGPGDLFSDDDAVLQHVRVGAIVLAAFAPLGAAAAAIALPAALQLVAGGRHRTRPDASRRAAASALPVLLVAVPASASSALTFSGDGHLLPGLVDLALSVVTVWLTVRICLAPAVAAAEGAGPLRSITRSWRLTRRAWWRTYGITLVLGLVGSLGSLVVFGYVAVQLLSPLRDGESVAFGSPVPVLVGSAFAAVSAVVLAVGQALLYVDLRCRREGLAWSLDAARTGDDRPDFGPGGVYGPPDR